MRAQRLQRHSGLELRDTEGNAGGGWRFGKRPIFTAVPRLRVSQQPRTAPVVQICILTSELVTSGAFLMGDNQRMRHRRDPGASFSQLFISEVPRIWKKHSEQLNAEDGAQACCRYRPGSSRRRGKRSARICVWPRRQVEHAEARDIWVGE